MKRNTLLTLTALLLAPLAGLHAADNAASLATAPGRDTPKTYYLDGDTGADTNDGTSPDRPWKSLARANQIQFLPGDNLLLKAGTRYSGQLKPKGSGRIDSQDGKVTPVVIGKYGEGPNPRIDAEGKYQASLELYNVQGYEVSELELTNTGPTAQPKRWGAYVHLYDFGKAAHLWLKRLYIHDVNGSPFKDDGSSGGMVWSNGGRKNPSFFDSLRIEDCHVERCERDGIRGINIDTARNSWHPSVNVVIRNNLIETIPGDAIVVKGCDGALVESNICRNFTRPPELGPGTVSAGIWPSGSDNTLIQFNEVSGHKAQQDGQGFDSDYNCRNTIIQYNYSHDNEGGFLLVCNPGDQHMPTNAGCVGTIVRYNVSVNDGLRATGKTADHCPIFHLSGPLTDTKIYNNTIIVPAKPNSKIDQTLVRCTTWRSGWPEKTLFANNIFYVEGETKYVWGEATNYHFDHNLYFGTHKDVPSDAHAIHADPLFQYFKSPQDGIASLFGLRLQTNSPAIGKGRSVDDAPRRDFTGKALPPDKPVSLGAFEFLAVGK